MVTVKEMREAPEDWKNPYIIDFEEPVATANGDREAWSLNKTSLKAIKLDGYTNPDELAGATIQINKVYVNNPQTGQLTWGLVWGGVVDAGRSPAKAPRKRMQKPARKTAARAAKRGSRLADKPSEDVPF